MKAAVFLLGALVGTALTYLVLTRVWWPDVRLEAAHREAGALVAPDPVSTMMPAPEAPSPEAPQGSSIALPPEQLSPPRESQSVQLPLLETDLATLRARALAIPVQGVGAGSLRDSFAEDRGGRSHEAIDILAARGTPVLAVEDGRVEKLFTSRLGGVTLYQFDVDGEYCYYYAHLERYADGLTEGALVRRGDVVGYVGTTGNAPPQTPHLHFAIFRLGALKQWWHGTAINAYTLWEPSGG